MSTYKNNYRTLDCWECFEAQGKMCHDENHANMNKITGSSNAGHAICCKPDYKEGLCDSNNNPICSLPSLGADTPANFKPILTA